LEDPGVGGVIALRSKQQSFVDEVPILFSIRPATLCAECFRIRVGQVIRFKVDGYGFKFFNQLFFAFFHQCLFRGN